MANTVDVEFKNNPISVMKWVIEDIKELKRQQRSINEIEERLEPDTVCGAVTTVFKEASEFLFAACILLLVPGCMGTSALLLGPSNKR